MAVLSITFLAAVLIGQAWADCVESDKCALEADSEALLQVARDQLRGESPCCKGGNVTAACWKQGFASCYGDYQNILNQGGISVACGYGNYITGENFIYTTAICNNWASEACGSCYEVQCETGRTANVECIPGVTTYVRAIDRLGPSCTNSPPRENHVFDLNDVPYKLLATDSGVPSCDGEYYVKYRAVSCSGVAGIVSGGLKISIVPNDVDPWCPPFVFSNVGGAGALYAVSVSSDGGSTWNVYRQQVAANGGRWDCTSGQGTYLSKPLSFRLELCNLAALPEACQASGNMLTVIDALPANWCGSAGSPCTTATFQVSENFQ